MACDVRVALLQHDKQAQQLSSFLFIVGQQTAAACAFPPEAVSTHCSVDNFLCLVCVVFLTTTAAAAAKP
jgi:hypothetical protein